MFLWLKEHGVIELVHEIPQPLLDLSMKSLPTDWSTTSNMNKKTHTHRKGTHHNKAKWLKQIQEKEQKRAKRTHVSMKIEYYSEDL